MFREAVLPPKRKDSFNYTMHYFRAIAILTIVIGHGLTMHHSFEKFESYSFRFFVNTICDSFFNTDSLIFCFISGYLFYIINRNDSIPSFIYKKIKKSVVALCLLLVNFNGGGLFL